MTEVIHQLRQDRSGDLARGLRERLRESQQRVARVPDPLPEGRLSRMVGMTLEAEGVRLPVGGRAAIHTASGQRLPAEVVGFHGEKTFLMPEGRLEGVAPGARIEPLEQARLIGVGPELLGRVIDANGKPLDDLGRIRASAHIAIEGRPINPLKRDPVRTPLDVGIRSLNGLLSVGRGQRLGLFAGSGVGKSVLLGMMTRHTEADVIVVGLIGERGREVNEFIHDILYVESRKRTVVVAVPADQPPLLRQHGAWVATAIA
jgi:flagellum-specific ATP synthase